MKSYPILTSPYQLGPLLLKNRIVSPPTSLAEVGPGNTFSKDNIAYYEMRAKGGAAIVNAGECIVHPNGVDHPSQIVLNNPAPIPSMYDLTEAIHKYGAYASIELGHGGKRCNRAFLPNHQLPIGPCDIFDEHGEKVCQGMTKEMMEEVLDGYRTSAANCAMAGFDLLTVHAGHGWLLAQFLSPLSNHREDEYGGSRENRCRYVIEVLKAVRAAAPKCVIELRISGSELTKGGYDLQEGIALCRLLEPYVDVFQVSVGVMEDLFTWIIMHPSMFVPDGCNVYLAEAIKKAVKKPVSCVGALGDADQLEEILASGKADLVCLARSLVADPELPNKVAEGRISEIRPCLRCFSCHGQMLKTRNIRCTVNPQIGREYDSLREIPARHRHKIAVVGGGPGGMQAAITAAERGHEVTLYEKENHLGGALKFAQHESFKRKLYQFEQWQENELKRLNVKVVLGFEVTRAFLDLLEVDTVICAVGAVPVHPAQFGIPGSNYILATDLFEEGVTLGQKIVIMGGGLVGCETGLHLVEAGKDVTILEMAPEIAMETTPAHRRATKVRMGLSPDQAGGDQFKPGIKVPTLAVSTKCKEITADGVLAVTPDGETKLFAADTVISALGLRARTALAAELRQCRARFVAIGDCVRPQQVGQAVRGAYDAVMALD